MSIEANEAGMLYVVATPIGNLEDISRRAIRTLESVDLILAEDTRHSARLLQEYGIATPMLPLHDHNERRRSAAIVERIAGGERMALICDAGTPLISDPGFHLVRQLREAHVRVVPIPGASALVCALSAAGLPSERFVFEGFLPAKQAARQRRLESLAQETRTLVFYESPHRVADCVADMVAIFGGEREASVARELTKTFETINTDCLAHLQAWVNEREEHRKGEFVVLVTGAPDREGQALTVEQRRVLEVLLDELPLKQAVSLAARITGAKRNIFYQCALSLSGEGKPEA